MMTKIRLLNISTLELEKFPNDRCPIIPRYIIASHRWEKSEEEYASNWRSPSRSNPVSFKVHGFRKVIRKHRRDIKWLWLDSICMEGMTHPEREEAVHSMFQWYRNAEACYSYLRDVTSKNNMEKSDWFKRCWTLQELLAPDVVVFFSRDWKILGHKCPGTRTQHDHEKYRHNLNDCISKTTQIDAEVLYEFENIQRLTKSDVVEDVRRWMDGRKATRTEDAVYSLFGIFDVSIALIYGEGKNKAWERFLKALPQTDPLHRLTIYNTRNGQPLWTLSSTSTDQHDFNAVSHKAPVRGAQSSSAGSDRPQSAFDGGEESWTSSRMSWSGPMYQNIRSEISPQVQSYNTPQRPLHIDRASTTGSRILSSLPVNNRTGMSSADPFPTSIYSPSSRPTRYVDSVAPLDTNETAIQRSAITRAGPDGRTLQTVPFGLWDYPSNTSHGQDSYRPHQPLQAYQAYQAYQRSRKVEDGNDPEEDSEEEQDQNSDPDEDFEEDSE